MVEDDQRIAETVRTCLTRAGFDFHHISHGDLARDKIVQLQPAAVLLDVLLPGCDGLTIARELRPDYSGPILMLTSRDEDIDEVLGLEAGADDYMSKPVRPPVLVARLRALLRRAEPQAPEAEPVRIEVGDLVIDQSTRLVTVAAKLISLSTAEFDLLWLLARNHGRILDRDEISRSLRGVVHGPFDRSIDLRVSKLRKKLGDDPVDPQRLKSIRGVGYILTSFQSTTPAGT